MTPPLQRFFAPFAIHSVLRILAGFQALMFILMLVLGPQRASMFLESMALDFGMVLHGQVWRMISFIVLPPTNPFASTGILFMIITVMFLFFINDLLEMEWGRLGLNAYFFLGFLGTLAGGLLAWLVSPHAAASIAFSLPQYFAASWLLAAATVAPQRTMLLFFIIPVPFWLFGILTGLSLIFASIGLCRAHLLLGAVPLLCVANYLLTFGPAAWHTATRKGGTIKRRRHFDSAKHPGTDAFHTCAGCGATERSHPEREFRVSASGDEFCDSCKDTRARSAP